MLLFESTICLTYASFKNRNLKVFKIIVKIFNLFVLTIYLFIVLFNVLLYLVLIRPAFCIESFARPNGNKVHTKKNINSHNAPPLHRSSILVPEIQIDFTENNLSHRMMTAPCFNSHEFTEREGCRHPHLFLPGVKIFVAPDRLKVFDETSLVCTRFSKISFEKLLFTIWWSHRWHQILF